MHLHVNRKNQKHVNRNKKHQNVQVVTCIRVSHSGSQFEFWFH